MKCPTPQQERQRCANANANFEGWLRRTEPRSPKRDALMRYLRRQTRNNERAIKRHGS